MFGLGNLCCHHSLGGVVAIKNRSEGKTKSLILDMLSLRCAKSTRVELVKHHATGWKSFRTIIDMRESLSFWTRIESCDHGQKTEEVQGVMFRGQRIMRVQKSPEK